MSEMWFASRAWACEVVFSLAMWICPEKYCPSYIEMIIEAQTKLTDRGWRITRDTASTGESLQPKNDEAAA